jgi:hypothetical protein
MPRRSVVVAIVAVHSGDVGTLGTVTRGAVVVQREDEIDSRTERVNQRLGRRQPKGRSTLASVDGLTRDPRPIWLDPTERGSA